MTRLLEFVDLHSRRLVIIGLLVIIAQSFYLNYAIMHEKLERRNTVNEAICSVIDAIPPGNDRIDHQRKVFECGSYQPPSIGCLRACPPSPALVTPSAKTPQPKPPVSPKKGNQTSPASLNTPAPPRTRVAPRVAPAPVTRTKTQVVIPRTPVTPKPRSTPASTPTPTTGVLDPITCGLLHLIC